MFHFYWSFHGNFALAGNAPAMTFRSAHSPMPSDARPVTPLDWHGRDSVTTARLPLPLWVKS